MMAVKPRYLSRYFCVRLDGGGKAPASQPLPKSLFQNGTIGLPTHYDDEVEKNRAGKKTARVPYYMGTLAAEASKVLNKD
jgi:hypothetical protein